MLSKRIFYSLILIVFASFFLLMLKILIVYIPMSSESSFLLIKQNEVNSLPYYLPIFYIHVYSTIFTLLAGFTQFSDYILKKLKTIHQAVGKIYVITILFFAAPSGFYMGMHANGNSYTKLSFIILSILWFLFTLKGFLFIREKKTYKHKQMMLYSFALTCSAITLRAWKVIFVSFFHPAPMDVYNVIAWLGWLPNIIFIWAYIRFSKMKAIPFIK